jgi:hypothetical protein
MASFEDPPHIKETIEKLRADHGNIMTQLHASYEKMKRDHVKYMDVRHELSSFTLYPEINLFLKQLQEKEDVFVICEAGDYNTNSDEFSEPYTRIWISPKKDGFIRERVVYTLEFLPGINNDYREGRTKMGN